MWNATIVLAPGLASVAVGIWRGKNFSRWALAVSVVILAVVALSIFVLPLNFANAERAGLAALSMMVIAGMVGPAIFTAKTHAVVTSLFAILLLSIPTLCTAYYAFMSYVCRSAFCY